MIDRIVVVNDISVPKGGATALALLSARMLRQRGQAVTFLAGDTGHNPALAAAGIDIVGLGQDRLLASSPITALTNGLYNRKAGATVAAWIRDHDTPGSVYHLHGWSQILSPAIFAALRPVSRRLVLSAHDFFLACPNGSFSLLNSGAVCPHVPMSAACIATNCDRRRYAHKLWRVARHAVMTHHYRRLSPPPILAIHERMRPFLMRAGLPGDNIRTLPNPVLPWTSDRIQAENNKEFLFVGRLEDTKGVDLAAAACRAAGVPLRVIGDGVLRAMLERDYPEVRLMGQQPPAVIADHARGARALVMPSRYPEPFGLVAAEALWSGLPVIATDTAFLTHDIVAAGAGVAIEPRDIAGFAGVLRCIADDRPATRAMSVAAYRHTQSIALSPEVWIDRLKQAYAERLARSPGTTKPVAGRSESPMR